jgi:hypothetical protein
MAQTSLNSDEFLLEIIGNCVEIILIFTVSLISDLILENEQVRANIYEIDRTVNLHVLNVCFGELYQD